MQRQQNRIRRQRPVQPTGNRFARPIGTLVELLPERRMRIRFGQNVPIAVLVEWMLQRIAVRWQLDDCCDIVGGSTLFADRSDVTATGELSLVLAATFDETGCASEMYLRNSKPEEEMRKYLGCNRRR